MALLTFASEAPAKDAEAQLGIYSVTMANPHDDGSLDATVTLGGHSCAGEQGAVTITLVVPNVRGPAEAREKIKAKMLTILQGLQTDEAHCEKRSADVGFIRRTAAPLACGEEQRNP